MAKYHTDSTEYPPSHREVYHNNENCSEGKKIELKHRVDGDGGKDLCKVC